MKSAGVLRMMNETQTKAYESYRRIAAARGGQCLSREYVSAATKMRWRCANGHEWEAEADAVKRGTWCRQCVARARKAGTLEKVCRIAESRGGACLSTEIGPGKPRLWWRCGEGHFWEAVASSIIQGTWCPECGGTRRLTIDDLRATAKEHGGKCLATEYLGMRTPVRWRCAEGHEWDSRPDNIRAGSWCTVCSQRAPYTLDDLRALAARHGGECHSKKAGRAVDEYLWRCRVGHFFKMLANSVQRGAWCPRCRSLPPGDIERMRRIARRHGGACLSRAYVDASTKLRFRCARGHEWETTPRHVGQGGWCPECRPRRGNAPLRIEDMRATAAARGGRCVSRVYVNSGTPLVWECANGHRWSATPARVRYRSWCPVCAHRNKGTIDGMRALAAERGGRCLSDEYLGQRTELRWECAAGHRFTATGVAVKSGVWCDACGGAARAPKWLPRAPIKRRGVGKGS